MRTVVFLFLLAGILPAQSFTIGVKGGVRLTTDLDNFDATSESKRYAVGPMVTAGLPFGFRLEVDALYRHVADRTSFFNYFGYVSERDSGNSWEFPIILRHGLTHGIYAGAGYAPRTINGSSHANVVNLLTFSLQQRNLPGAWDVTHGVVGVAGIEKRAGPVGIAPEVRYTFWTSPALNIYGPQGYLVQSSQHQVDLMVGIHFPAGRR
jgi:hypothetical protein